MVVDGQGSRETGGSSADRIFFMKYPLPFLQHWYTTYPPPQQDTTTTGSSVVSPSSVGGDTDMAGERTPGVTDSNFPHMPRGRLLSSITILLYPMTSSAVAPIQDNTQQHSSATLRMRLVRSVGLNEKSYTEKTRRCLLATSSSISKKHRKSVHHILPWMSS